MTFCHWNGPLQRGKIVPPTEGKGFHIERGDRFPPTEGKGFHLQRGKSPTYTSETDFHLQSGDRFPLQRGDRFPPTGEYAYRGEIGFHLQRGYTYKGEGFHLQRGDRFPAGQSSPTPKDLHTPSMQTTENHEPVTVRANSHWSGTDCQNRISQLPTHPPVSR